MWRIYSERLLFLSTCMLCSYRYLLISLISEMVLDHFIEILMSILLFVSQPYFAVVRDLIYCRILGTT